MKQITVICKANANPVTAITELLSSHQVNIEGFDFNQSGEDAYLSISVSDYDTSLSLLVGKGYNAVSDEVVLIRGNNRPGELAEIARTLTDAGVQIRSLTLLDVRSDAGLVAIITDKNEIVRDFFAERLVN